MIQESKNFKVCPLDKLHKRASKRLPGYVEECLRRGQFDPGTQTVTLTLRDFNEIRKMFNPKTGVQSIAPGCCG